MKKLTKFPFQGNCRNKSMRTSTFSMKKGRQMKGELHEIIHQIPLGRVLVRIFYAARSGWRRAQPPELGASLAMKPTGPAFLAAG